ncbi:MAG: hypothetical protein NT014_00640, partial [Candidatus Omnitrophica bacterium]|nr:hypothetical protein [Candidatus Omnitrophota bacterium]
MGKIKSFFFCSIFYFSFLSLSFSQTITLKSGQKIEGKIIEQTDKYVKVEFEGVELIFYNDEIFSIDQTSSAGANTITPEMELLYKAYTASLNTTQSTKTETKVVSGADLLEKAKVDTVVSSSQKDVDSPESVDLLP